MTPAAVTPAAGDTTADVVVIGAGAVGSACAYFAARHGLRVHVVERGQIVSGTSSACEGNMLNSDKDAGPELELAKYSHALYGTDLAEHNALWEYERKGGIAVAATEAGAAGLAELTTRQRASGVEAIDLPADRLRDFEPHISPDLCSGAYYPEDAQVQPMLLAAHLLRLARGLGAVVQTGAEVIGFLRDGDRVTGVRTRIGEVSADAVINAAGTWSGNIAKLAGVKLPILPRRGFVLVTEPLPLTIRHKVYDADYVANVLSSDGGLQTSTVVEGTDSGTVLIGSSRERVGFDRTVSLPVMAEIAAKAVALFPMLASVKVMRSYLGFRPYSADHQPVIGPDPRAPGLWHASGHEGAGIGLSAGTGKLLAQSILGQPTDLDLTPFRPERFSVGLSRSALRGHELREVSLVRHDSVRRSIGSARFTRGTRRPESLLHSREAPPMTESDGRAPEQTFTFDGGAIPVQPGQSVGAALVGAGIRSWRTTRKNGRPRGLFCGIGICYDCLITIDGVPNQRACLTPAKPGMQVASDEAGEEAR